MQLFGLPLPSVAIGVAIAVSFTLWPQIGRWYGMPIAWTNSVTLVMSTIAGLALSVHDLRTVAIPNAAGIIAVGLVALFNGAAVYFYSQKTGDPTISIAAFGTLVMVSMVVSNAALSWALHKETVSVIQMGGLALIVVGIIIFTTKW